MSNPLHLFIIHNGTTGLVAKLVAQRLQLAPEQIRVAYTNDTTYKMGLELTEGKEEYLIDWQQTARQYTDYYVECKFTAQQYYDNALQIRSKLYSFLQEQEYICYVPCSDNAGFFLPFNFTKCIGLGFLEEGTLHYLGSTYYASDYESIIDPFLAENPEYEYERSGIPPARRQHPLDVDNIIYNPKLGTAENPIVFYRLTSYAFNYREAAGSDSKQLDFVTFSVEEVFNIPYTSKILPYYAKLLKADHVPFPDFFTKQIRVPVWILDTVFPNYCDKAKFQALYNHIASSLQYGLYKHIFIKPHPNHVVNTVILEFLDRLCKGYELEYTLLGSDCIIEQELALFPNNTLEIHGVTSSALLYAKFFNQNVCSYVELLQRDQPWNKFISAIYFNPQEILAEVTRRHQQEIDKDPAGFKEHERLFHQRKLQNIQGQLLALDYCYLQALYQNQDLALIKEMKADNSESLTRENIRLLLTGDKLNPKYPQSLTNLDIELHGLKSHCQCLTSEISENLRILHAQSAASKQHLAKLKILAQPNLERINTLTSVNSASAEFTEVSSTASNTAPESAAEVVETDLYQPETIKMINGVQINISPTPVDLGLPNNFRISKLSTIDLANELFPRYQLATDEPDLDLIVLNQLQEAERLQGWLTQPLAPLGQAKPRSEAYYLESGEAVTPQYLANLEQLLIPERIMACKSEANYRAVNARFSLLADASLHLQAKHRVLLTPLLLADCQDCYKQFYRLRKIKAHKILVRKLARLFYRVYAKLKMGKPKVSKEIEL